MPAVQDHRHVDVEHVAVLELPLARDAVADDVVDRGADGLRVAAIVQRRRHRAVLGHEIVAELVQRAGRDARHDMRRDHVQGFRRQAPGGAHPGKILWRVDRDASRVGSAVHPVRSVCRRRLAGPGRVARPAARRQDAQPARRAQGRRPEVRPGLPSSSRGLRRVRRRGNCTCPADAAPPRPARCAAACRDPTRLALGLGLHLEQIGGELAAAVGPDAALAERVVVGRDRLHLRHRRPAALLRLRRTHRRAVFR